MPATEPLHPDRPGRHVGADPLTGLDPAPSTAILHVLRVALHVGFAGLLGVAVLRLLVSGGGGSLPYGWALLALVLAGVYLAGTLLEKRYSTGGIRFNPGRYGVMWLAVVTVLWALLLAASADFAWLAFPLFFLHLHVLPRRIALPTIALMTTAVIAAQWSASGLEVPHVAVILGPVLGAGFSVVTGLAYRALYREAENQRRAADELRRTRAELAAAQHAAGVLAERERLAREIHDTLAQGLSSIVLVSRAAEKSLADGDAATAGTRLALVQQTAAENLSEARNFVLGLASPHLQGTPLVENLGRLCEKTESDAAACGAGLRCRLEVDGVAGELPQTHQEALLRAAQASLANVADHARADTAVVTLAFLGDEVTMDVYDDGRGFEPATVGAGSTVRAAGRGFGLRSLQERVTALHGSVEIESAPGQGTVVAIRLPLELAGSGGAGKAAP